MGGASPTQAVISSFSAFADGGRVIASWETASEVGTAGFNLYRIDPETGARSKVNGNLVPGLIESPQGGRYFVTDQGVSPGQELTYLLEEIESRGSVKTYGPYTVVADQALDSGNASECPCPILLRTGCPPFGEACLHRESGARG